MDKVFVIGWQKTGTTTITRILSDLGFRSIHTPVKLICNEWYPDGAPEGKKMNFDIDNFRLRLNYFTQEYDAFSDNPICLEKYLPVIADEYPDAAFIYTSRDIKPWSRSAFLHLHSSRTYNIFRRRLELYTNYSPKNGIYASSDPLGLSEYIYGNAYPYITVNNLKQSYRRHQKTVYDIFKGLSNFLEVDFSADVNISKIPTFLGLKDKKIQSIPHLNSRKKSFLEVGKANYRSVVKKLVR